MPVYPASHAARDRFVLERRAPRPAHDPWAYHDLVIEDERTSDGRIVKGGTVFLTGRECPWRCVMCDLWRYTIPEDTPRGAIAAQIAAARRAIGTHAVTQLKLYNAGSFFDPHAVPDDDYDDIAAQLTALERVIVESHPSLVGPRVDRFIESLDRRCAPPAKPAALEVAMGLETAHPDALQRLHKRMTVETFARAAERLALRRVTLRVFLLVAPPCVPSSEQDVWLERSVDCAFSCGASVVSLIPTRPGNGALDALAAEGHFRPPRLDDVERSLERGLASAGGRGRVFVDLWDLERFSACSHCYGARRARLHTMNLEQCVLPPVPCSHCDVGATHASPLQADAGS